MGNKARTPMWHFDANQVQRLLPIFETDDEKPEIVYSDKQHEEILSITRTKRDMERFLKFCKEIEPAISTEANPQPKEAQKRDSRRKVIRSFDKFMDDLAKLDLFWDFYYDKNKFSALFSIKNWLKMTDEELRAKSKKSNKHHALAAAVGQAMKKSGIMKVSSYYSAEHDRMGNAAKVIEVCIEAAGQPPTKNLNKLAIIAMQAAKLGSN